MEVIGFFIMIMVVPVAVMVCLTPRRRVIAFVFGLVLAWDGALLARFSEEYLFWVLVPAGAVISLAALLVEIPLRLRGRGPSAGQRAATGADADGCELVVLVLRGGWDPLACSKGGTAVHRQIVGALNYVAILGLAGAAIARKRNFRAAFFRGLGLAACIYWPGSGLCVVKADKTGDPRGWWVILIALSLGHFDRPLLLVETAEVRKAHSSSRTVRARIRAGSITQPP